MAIRRCPYCKAIIDEQDKYCNNCGTQLLFPEDEFVEEEIPGDRIVEEEEEKESDEDELGETEEPEETKPLEEEEEPEEEEEELEEEEKEEEEEEFRAEAEAETEEREAREELEEDLEEEAEAEEIERPVEEISAAEQVGKAAPAQEPQKKYKVSIEEDELVFKTKDLDSLTGTVDEGREKLEEFLSSFQKEKTKSVTPHDVPALFQEGEEPGSTTKEGLPPWASGMKESPPSTADLEQIAEAGTRGEVAAEKAPTRPEWTTDSGIGIPEKVTQAPLPFTDTAVVSAAEDTGEAVQGEVKEGVRAETRPRTRFSLKLRSKLVDLVFITALWLITLWFTAQVIGVSFLRLVAGSPLPVLAFYFILLLLYFFLFLYFLGETLGDHFFSED